MKIARWFSFVVFLGLIACGDSVTTEPPTTETYKTANFWYAERDSVLVDGTNSFISDTLYLHLEADNIAYTENVFEVVFTDEGKQYLWPLLKVQCRGTYKRTSDSVILNLEYNNQPCWISLEYGVIHPDTLRGVYKDKARDIKAGFDFVRTY